MNLQSKLMEKQLDSLQERFEASATKMEEKLDAMLASMEVMLFSMQQPNSQPIQQSTPHLNPSIKGMAGDFSLVTTNLGDAETDEQKGIEMNKTATENVLAEASSVGTSNISDADLDEGKEVTNPNSNLDRFPMKEYECNICFADCSYKRYKSNNVFDCDICPSCFFSGRFELGLAPLYLICIEYVEDYSGEKSSKVFDEREIQEDVVVEDNYGVDFDSLESLVSKSDRPQTVCENVQRVSSQFDFDIKYSVDPQAKSNSSQPSVSECAHSMGVISHQYIPIHNLLKTDEDEHSEHLVDDTLKTNVASGTSEHTQVAFEQDDVPKFVELLGSPSDDVQEQAVWALGNVAGDSPACRDFVLAHGALMPLLRQLNENSKMSMLRNATWTLSNFCRGKPPAAFEKIKPALGVLAQLIHSSDEEVLTDTCWALSYLSDGTNDKIQAVIEAGVCPRLVELLLHPLPTVLVPALRTVGNIVTGDDAQTQFIVDNRVLPCLHQLLTQNHKKSIKKEACWTISNITAGNQTHIQAVIDSNIIAPLVLLLQHAEFEIKKEAAWAISNATSGGSNDQIHYLVSQGCIKPLCDLLLCPDPRIITVCLEGIENILKVGESKKESGKTNNLNVYAQMIDECDGLDKLESLQGHDNNEIYERAVKMLECYWLEDEEEDDQNNQGMQQPPEFGAQIPPQGGFNFG